MSTTVFILANFCAQQWCPAKRPRRLDMARENCGLEPDRLLAPEDRWPKVKGESTTPIESNWEGPVEMWMSSSGQQAHCVMCEQAVEEAGT